MAIYGGIEAGGTKFVCAVGSGPDELRAVEQFRTSTPEVDIPRAIDFLRKHGGAEGVTAVGIASFGPVDPDPRSPKYGYVTTTPKPGWAHTDFAGPIGRALGVPVGFDSDVNGAALGEHRWGAGQGLDTVIYITVGTGLGGGGLVNGRLIHGLMHSEMGHLRVPHDWAADPYAGFCTYHGDCWEGLSAGPAIEGRWGIRGEELPPDHPAWLLEADYLAYGLVAIICVTSPQRIIMGGGVMHQMHLFPMVRARVKELLNGYIQHAAILERIDEYIVPPALGDRAGIAGALALAQQAQERTP